LLLARPEYYLGPLFLGHTAPLAATGHCLAGAALGAGIGARALAPDGQAETVPEPAVAANLDEALDVEVNLFSELALNAIVFIDNLAEPVELILGEFIYLGLRCYLGLSQNLLAQGGAEAIDILQRDPGLLICGYVYSGNAWHLLPPETPALYLYLCFEPVPLILLKRYPCLCLCFGLVQITLTTPRRLTILHFSHLALTEALTFII
jgi:hypothetical protein